MRVASAKRRGSHQLLMGLGKSGAQRRNYGCRRELDDSDSDGDGGAAEDYVEPAWLPAQPFRKEG